jgi:error-prone DNA polymerase
MIKGLSRSGVERLLRARAQAGFFSTPDMARRASLDKGDLQCLAAAGALAGLAGNRHQAAWQVMGIESALPLHGLESVEEDPLLPLPTEGQEIRADYATLGLTLGRHPLALLRSQLRRQRVITAAAVRERRHGQRVRTAGIVIGRQRPASANSVTFVTLEDETGQVNLVIWKQLAERQRNVLLKAQLLGVSGEVQREGEVLHLIASRLWDYSALLGHLLIRSRDFH